MTDGRWSASKSVGFIVVVYRFVRVVRTAKTAFVIFVNVVFAGFLGDNSGVRCLKFPEVKGGQYCAYFSCVSCTSVCCRLRYCG